jgi:hypothetical protein
MSVWSFLAPIGALIYSPETGNYWFVATVVGHILLLPLRAYLYNSSQAFFYPELIHLLNFLLINTLMYFSLNMYVGDLKKTKQKLGVVNTFLQLHNRKLSE